MKLIDVDSKATLEDFLTLKKKTELVQVLRKCNEKMSCYRKFNKGFNFYEENYIHDIPFF